MACISALLLPRTAGGVSSPTPTLNVTLLEAANNAGRTALSVACNHGQDAVVAFLLKHGASVTAADKQGWTALHVAAAVGFHRICQMLIATGAATDATTADGKTPAQLAATEATLKALGGS